MKSEIPVYDIQNLKIFHKRGILISRFGHYFEHHQHLLAAHRHNFYHMVIFTEGSGTQQIDFSTYPIEKNTMYFMVPGQVHQWNFQDNVDGFIVNFNKDYFSDFLVSPNYIEKYSFFSGNSNEQTILLSDQTTLKCVALFKEMLNVDHVNIDLADDFIKSSLMKIFTTVAIQSPIQQETTYNHTLIQNFRRLIESNYDQLKLPKEYAALLYITPNHLNAVCKDFLGQTAGNLIRDRILLEAKRMLTNVDVTIAEIAEKLGFADQSYFVKFFKKAENLTPDKFRKLNFTHHGKS